MNKQWISIILIATLIYTTFLGVSSSVLAEDTTEQSILEEYYDDEEECDDEYDDEDPEDVNWGYCGADGNNVMWTLNDGILTFSGYGEMKSYSFLTLRESPFRALDGFINKVVIEQGVTNVGEELCWGVKSLEEVEIAQSVETIECMAFDECTNLSVINIDGDPYIEEAAFDDTKWLKSQPAGAAYLGNVLYRYKGKCPNTIKIKNGTTSIAEQAFLGKKTLQKVTVPGTVKAIGEEAFSECNIKKLTIDEGVETIGAFAFSYNYNLKKVAIPKSVKRLCAEAFEECGLKKVVIKNRNMYIEPAAFYNTPITNMQKSGAVYVDSALVAYENPKKKKNLKIKSGTSIISEWAFENSNIKGITIPKSTRTIGDGVFFGCNSLSSIAVASDNPVYDSRDNCNAIIKTEDNELIAGCKNTIIPRSVKKIRGWTFYSCSGLKNITIPGNVKIIENSAFESCYKLKSVTIENGVENLERCAILDCPELKSIKIPESVTAIGEKAIGYMAVGLKLVKIEGFTIYGTSGSAAEQYAIDNGFAFEEI